MIMLNYILINKPWDGLWNAVHDFVEVELQIEHSLSRIRSQIAYQTP